MVGEAQFDRAAGASTAEVAVEVERSWQQVGLGTALMAELARRARALGVQEFTARYLADNVPVQRLLRDSGHLVSSSFGSGEGTARIDITTPEDAGGTR